MQFVMDWAGDLNNPFFAYTDEDPKYQPTKYVGVSPESNPKQIH
ncbi:hypothetical protein [Bacillus massiliglaciei]|nr:hypothetical protein [Bacillus massiliglaciei]